MAKKKKQTEQKPLTQADIQKVMEIAKNDISNSTSVDGNFSISNSNSATINPNTQSTPLTDTQLQARQYIQSIYDSNASVPTSNNNEIPSLKDNYVQGSNPNIPDEDARMKARDYINNVMNGKINEDGTLNEQKKQTKIQSPSKNTKKNSENVFDTIGKNGAKAFNKAKDLAKDIVPSSVEKKNPTTSEEKNNLVVDKSNNTIPTLSAKDQNRILYDVQNYNLANNKPITKEGTQEKPNFHRASANDAKNKTTKAEGGSGGSTYIGETTPESVVKTNEKYANPDVQRTGTWGKTRKDLENAQKYAEEFEKKYNLDFNPSTMGATETEKQKEQELINSGVVTQEQLDAMRNVGFYNSAEENVGSAIVNFGSSLAKPFTAIGGLFSDSMKEADKSRAEAEEYAQKVAPKSSMVGQFAGNTVLYSGANELLGGAKEGVSLLGRIGRGQAADTVLDTIPTIASNINQGEYTDENGNFNTSALIKDIVENQATNLAFNLGAEGLEEIGKRASKKNANAIPTVENNALVNNADSLKNLENNVANNLVEPTENIVKNADNDLATRYARTVGAENDANYVKQLREDFESGNTYDYLENMNKYIKENPDNLAEEVLNENRIIRDELYDRAIIDANGNVKYGEYALSDANDVKNLRDSLANSPMRNSLAEADALNYEENIRALDRWLEKHNYTEVPQNVPQMAENVSQVPQNVAKPKVEYNTKNVEGFTRMDSNLTSMQKMFGDSTTEPKVAQMKALLNEYATTGNIEAYNQAKQIADELDGYLKGSKYNTKKGRTIKYGDTDTFSFEVENSANAMNNMASVRSVDIPGHEELNSKIDNLVADFGANDDSSKIAIELKQSINDLANDTSVDNLRAVQQKTQDLYYSLENSEKLTNAYRNKTQKFGYDDIKEIADETEQIYKDSVTDYRGNKAEYKPIENVADTKPINNTEDSVPTKPLSEQVENNSMVNSAIEDMENSVAKSEPTYAPNRYTGDANQTIQKTNIDDSVKDAFKDNPRVHEVLKNEDTYNSAKYILENNSTNDSIEIFNYMLNKKDPTSVVLGYEIADKLAKEGNTELAVDIIDKIGSSLTESGQFSQAAAITMMKNNPMSALSYMKKQIDKLNKTGVEKYGRKWKNFALTEDEIKAFSDIKQGDKKAIEDLYDNITKRMAKEYPSTKWEKVVELSKFSMMFNPRTHIRNVGANAALLPIRSVSDRISALGQNAYKLFNPDYKVTQSVLGGTREQKKIANQVFDEYYKPLLSDNNEWKEVTKGVQSQKQVFNDSAFGKYAKKFTLGSANVLNRMTGGRLENFVKTLDNSMTDSVLENARQFNYWLLGAVEDDPFVKKNFSNRLASYMKAQGIKNMEDIPAEALDIAWNESLKATFKDDNQITRMFSNIKKDTGKFGEIMLPFTKTPANIAARSIDYSPVGVVNAIKKLDGSSQKSVSDFFDNIGKSALGTSGIYLGYLLAKNGMIQGALSSDKNEKAFQQQQGKVAFSVKTPMGYYSFDWMQPASIPIIMGSTIYDAINEDDEEIKNYLDIGWQGTKAAFNEWADLSPLSSLNDIFGGNSYSGENDIGQNIMNEVMEFPLRLIPALSNATAKAVDPTVRETYVKGSQTDTILNQVKAKIPFLSEEIPASYDTWGNERVRQNDKVSSFVANFLNPGTLGNDTSTEIDPEVERLYEETKNNKVFPQKADYTVKNGDGETITLDNKQHSELQREQGQMSYNLAKMFMESKEYENLSDESKVDILNSIYSFSRDYSKNKLFGTPLSNSKSDLADTYNSNPQDYIDGLVSKSVAEKNANELQEMGIPVNDVTKEAYANNKQGTLNAWKKANAKAQEYGLENITTSQYNKYMECSSGDRDKYLKYIAEIKKTGSESSADGTKEGFEAYKNGTYGTYIKEKNAKEERANDDVSKALQSLSVYSTETRNRYDNAKKEIPSLKPREYANTVRKIDTNKNGVSQDELIAYFNKNNVSQSEATKMWKAYGKSDWKSVPVLQGKTYKKKK